MQELELNTGASWLGLGTFIGFKTTSVRESYSEREREQKKQARQKWMDEGGEEKTNWK